jgi:hypothetical protein
MSLFCHGFSLSSAYFTIKVGMGCDGYTSALVGLGTAFYSSVSSVYGLWLRCTFR